MSKRIESFIDGVDQRIDNRLPQSPEAIKRRSRALRAAGAILAVLGTGWAASETIDAVNEPSYSESTHTYVVDENDSLYSISRDEDEIKNALNVDIRETMYYIDQLPENKEALEDGLQEGDKLQLPDSVDE